MILNAFNFAKMYNKLGSVCPKKKSFFKFIILKKKCVGPWILKAFYKISKISFSNISEKKILHLQMCNIFSSKMHACRNIISNSK